MEDDMPFIGFKASESMVKKLDEVAKRKGVGRSELIRDLIRNNLDTTDDFSNWKVYAWNLFGINNDQLRYAMGTSETAEEFFSIISKWSKNIKIYIIPSTENVKIKFSRDNKDLIISEARILGKVKVIASIIEKLDSEIAAEFTI
jgi:hypothetical protein